MDLGKPVLSHPRRLGAMPRFGQMTKLLPQLHGVLSVMDILQGKKLNKNTIFFAAHIFPSPHRTALPTQIVSLLGRSHQSKGKSTHYATQVLYTDNLTGNCVFTL